jgi:hypothetical protein
MSYNARVFSEEDFAHVRRLWIAVGVLIGFAICTLLLIVNVALKPRSAIAGPAKAEHRGPGETVSVQMVMGSRNYDCLITLNRVTGIYIVNCGE